MTKRRIVVLLLIIVSIMALVPACARKDAKSEQIVYIAWSNRQDSYSFISTLRTVEAAGAKPVVLEQALSDDLHYDKKGELTDADEDEHGILTPQAAKKVKVNTWQNSNVETIMKGVDCVIFPGGSDICPSLYYHEQRWHGITDDTDYSSERDVSDYILLSYCLEHDIPVLAICRGMQMLAVITDGTIVQDFSLYYNERGQTYDNMHRQPPSENQDYAVHDVAVTSADSIFRRIVGADALSRVPSWHHQGVLQTEKSRFVTTGYTVTGGIPLVEAMEVPGKKFALGVQFHPEIVVSGNPEGKEKEFFDYDTAMRFFEAIAGK